MRRIQNQQQFLESAVETLKNMTNTIEELKSIDLSQLEPTKTMAFIIDINKGFAVSGSLFSPRIGALIPETVVFAKELIAKGIKVFAFSDKHTKDSPELASYPAHCMDGTEECEIVEEVAVIEGVHTLYKNSTNAFTAINPLTDFTDYYTLEELEAMDTFIIAGDCTDICIYQFATTLKAYLNQHNKEARVIVPVDLVDTYDAPWHNGDFMNIVFLNSMISNGIEVVSSIALKS